MHWLAICDASDAPRRHRPLPPQPMPELLGVGTLIVEAALSAAPECEFALIDFATEAGWTRCLRLVLAPDGVLRLEQQQGAGLASVALRVALPRGMQGLRVTYAWNAPERRSRLTAEVLFEGRIVSAAGANPLPIPAEDFQAIFAAGGQGLRHARVSWMGLSSDESVPNLGAAVSGATPIDTPAGAMRADALRAGDLVETRDHGPQPLRWAGRLLLPAQGSFTPIRLRAPYFAEGQDLIVAPGQRLALSGAEVEYLFGEEEVLVGARHLLNGRSAFYETRRAFVTYVFLLFARHEVIEAAGCAIESLFLDPAAQPGLPMGVDAVTGGPARRHLEAYEAVTLKHMLARSLHLDAA